MPTTFTTLSAAVDRADADECGDEAAVEATEFGQLGRKGPCGDVADAGTAGQDVLGFAPSWTAADGAIDVAVACRKLGL
jgi:hypothetical protein